MARYIAITGGVGGAKLGLGLSHVLSPDELAFIVNTGDDFQHLGLHVSPDLDTLMYTLGGLSNPDTGWGRVGESWNFIDSLRQLGGPDWFNLGDRDLAVHVLRSERLSAGWPLSQVTETLYTQLGVRHAVWPMSDDPVRTRVSTDQGVLDFQHYFVRERCEPSVKAIDFDGADAAAALPAALEYLAADDLAGVIICPSNPYLSIDPILAVPALRRALLTCRAPKIAISPLIGGEAVKGPTAKIMSELGLPLTAATIAAHYGGLLNGFVIDHCDAQQQSAIANEALVVMVTNTLMSSLDDRIELAQTALNFLDQLRT